MYNPKKFECVREFQLNFTLRNGVNYDADDALSREMRRPAVGMIDVLRHRQSGRTIGVAAAHFPFDPYKNIIKFGVMVLMLRAIKKVKESLKLEDVFFSGDFNFVPNSMLYDYVTNGKLDLDVPEEEFSNQTLVMRCAHEAEIADLLKISDRKFTPSKKEKFDRREFLESLAGAKVFIGNSKELKFRKGQPLTQDPAAELRELASSLGLTSVYAEAKNRFWAKNSQGPSANALSFRHPGIEFRNEAFPTQLAPDIKSTFDYILIGRGKGFTPSAVLELPSLTFLAEDRRSLPFGPFSSDHFSLVADFELPQ